VRSKRARDALRAPSVELQPPHHQQLKRSISSNTSDQKQEKAKAATP
jgi:hypothetical protein